MPGFCPRDWMNAPMVYCVIGPIFSFSCANLAGGKRSSNHAWYVSKSKSGTPTRKFDCPNPAKGESQLSLDSRFFSKALTSGDFGATTPQPKMPTRLGCDIGDELYRNCMMSNSPWNAQRTEPIPPKSKQR